LEIGCAIRWSRGVTDRSRARPSSNQENSTAVPDAELVQESGAIDNDQRQGVTKKQKNELSADRQTLIEAAEAFLLSAWWLNPRISKLFLTLSAKLYGICGRLDHPRSGIEKNNLEPE
jgi:hypothetical protein